MFSFMGAGQNKDYRQNEKIMFKYEGIACSSCAKNWPHEAEVYFITFYVA